MNKEQLSMNNIQRIETKVRRTINSLFFVLCLLSFVIGCQEPLTTGNNLADIPEGKGSFSLTLSNARTILPNTPSLSDFAVYSLDFSNINSGAAVNVDRTNETIVTTPVLLEPGIYNLIVNAYKDTGKNQLMARGTLDGIIIIAGENTPAAVTLEAILSGGTGTFKWEITLPAGVTTAGMTIRPGNSSGTNLQTITLTSSTASGSCTLNSGPYNLTFNLTKTDGKSVVWKELLYVYQNLESFFVFSFTDAHFSDSAYTVTYNYNDGVTSNQAQSIMHGDTLTTPSPPTNSWYAFSGWYTDNDTFANLWNFDNPVIESFTLYAMWDDSVSLENVTGLVNKLAWLQARAQSNNSYVLEVSADESIGPHTLSYSGRSGITITLIGVGASRTVSLSSNGAMFTVDSSITLILDNNITLRGRSSNTNSLVRVNGGSLDMKTGSTISGNTSSSNSSSYGGGVYVSGGTFTMIGGKISGNTSYISSTSDSGSYGGGVYVSGGTFTMNGGEISGNSSYTSSSSYSYSVGGGVCVSGNESVPATFTMTGGKISGNTSSTSYADYYNYTPAYGGGVYVSGGTFTMTGGEISNNASSSPSYTSDGGGVYVSQGTFIMENGIIFGNRSSSSSSGSYGGGVNVSHGTTFTMNGGEISGNTSSLSSSSYVSGSCGGGVYVGIGTFTMNGGEISGNTSSSSSSYSRSEGGGVYMGSGTFTMTGGKISGNTSSSSSSNSGSYGGGVYVTDGTFDMGNGTISGNTSSSSTDSYGGGVYMYSGTFNMRSGTISGNTSGSYGGGVYIYYSDGMLIIYDKTGGTITGYGNDTVNGNVVRSGNAVINDRGHAVYAAGGKRKETTAGPEVNLSFNDPSTWSGEWDY